MADRRQAIVAAWPPRALLALTTPRAGWLELEHALLPLHSLARALPPLHFLRSPEAPQQLRLCSAVLALARRGTVASQLLPIAPP